MVCNFFWRGGVGWGWGGGKCYKITYIDKFTRLPFFPWLFEVYPAVCDSLDASQLPITVADNFLKFNHIGESTSTS